MKIDFNKYINEEITKEEALALVNLKGNDLLYLFAVADKIRNKYCGNILETCTITNAKSGKCSEDCKFCAQSAWYNTDIKSYPIKDKETLKKEFYEAEKNKSMRFGIVTAGKKMKSGTSEFNTVLEFIKEITSENPNTRICCSLGLLGEKELFELKKAGASRYHCNIQTSPDTYSLYAAATHSFKERIETIKNAQKAGLEICSGGIIGMGESFEDRINMAFTLKELDVDGIPINILNPIKNTPHGEKEILSAVEILKTIAVFRLILKDKNIKIAAGRENIFKDFMGSGFLSGANGMLAGGYLTVKGRSVEEDINFIENIKKLWD